MRKEIVSTENAPKAIGPYSQAIRFGNIVYVSGQIPIRPESGKILKGTIEEQTIQVLENLKNILAAAGLTLDNVLRTTIFLTDLGDYSAVNEIYARYFGDSQPARSTVQVSRLPMDAQIEIDAIAGSTT